MASKGNFIEAEGLVKKLNEAFTDHVKVVQMSVQTVKSLNDEYKKLPSDYAKGLKDVTETYNKSAVAVEKLKQNTQKLVEAKAKLAPKTSEEIVNGRALAQNTDRQTRATSALVGAYANLNAKHQQASVNLQNLIVRGRTATQTQEQYNRELRLAERDFQKLNQRIISADRAVGRFNRNVGNYPSTAVRGLKDLIGAFGIVGGVSLFAMVARDVVQTAKELQGLNNALILVTETQTNFAEQQLFLQRISEAYGLEIMGLTKQFTQFYVSAKDKLSGQQIQEIFESISKAGASMGLSIDAQNRAFLALNQMMSKGTVMAEELRGQLGEALPGAFGIMAKALDVNEKQLGVMMQQGQLLSADVLPKFARQLEKTYGIENINRIETMTTATNRLSNAWTSFVATIAGSDGVLSKSFTKILNFLAQSVAGFRLMTMTKAERSLERIGEIVAKNTSEYKEYLNDLDLTNEKIVEQEKASLRLGIVRSQNARREIELLNEQLKALEGRGTVFEKDRTQLRNRIELLEIERQKYLAQVSVFDEVVKAQNKKTEATKLETTAIKEKNKVVKEERELIVGSVEWLEKEISMLKEKQSQMSTTTEEYQQHQTEIQTLIGSLEILTGKYKGLGTALKDVGVSISDFDLSDEGVSKWYDEMAEGFQNPLGDGTDWKDDFQQWSQVALDAIQVVRDAQEQAFQAELFRLEQSRDNAIRFAGESETARAEIDRQYDEKRRALLNRQAKQEKAFAITQSIINTAQGVISALAMTPPNVPLSIAIGVIGAAQTALIASQQIPQFYKGTDNAPEGMAWTQERGAEIITDKSGKVKSLGSNKGAQLTHLNKGDKVFTAQESKSIMFNKELNSILSNNGIANASTIVNNSLDLSPLRSDIKSLENVIKNKSELQMISDRQGERVYKKEQGKRALIVSNRLRIKS
jgi:tape measure domain-containing protein